MSVPEPTPPRADRSSRILAIVIIAAIVVPVVWLVLSSALRGRDAVDLDRPGTSELPRLTSLAP